VGDDATPDRYARGRGAVKATIFDYGAGNLHSLAKAIETDGVTVDVEVDPVLSIQTDVLVLPGVGAFGAAVDRLSTGRDAMRRAILGGLPVIGICLGMQLFFDTSDEGGGNGLGVIPGHVTRLDAQRVPQIGWNDIVTDGRDPVFAENILSTAYYANSYVCRPADIRTVLAWTTHEGDRFPAAVRSGSAVGVQFHPEKSSASGVHFLHALIRSVEREGVAT
jgi:glutamine amidotransferase